MEWVGEARRLDGSNFEVSITTLPSAAPVGHRVLTVRDASRRAARASEIERLRRRLARQPSSVLPSSAGRGMEFFAKQVHELRNPLAVLTAMSAFVLEQVEQRGLDDLTQDLRDMVTASNQLRALVDRTLDVSKLEAGRMSVMLEPVKIRPLVEELVHHNQVVAADRGNALVLDCAERPGSVLADDMRLRQVLSNLLGNAIKFTRDGAITLRVRRLPGHSGTEVPRVIFQVIDTGVGMTAEQADTIFQDYVQADHDRARKSRGTGLGLALVTRFADMMGGEVRVDSVLGEGSTFTLELPATLGRTTGEEAACLPPLRSGGAGR